MRYKPTKDVDEAAEALAQRLGGLPSRTIPGFGNREFDAVSDHYIAQTTASRSAVLRPANFLTGERKAQIRATLQVAKQEGKIAYFEFTAGRPHIEVVDCIDRNARRFSAEHVIVPEKDKP